MRPPPLGKELPPSEEESDGRTYLQRGPKLPFLTFFPPFPTAFISSAAAAAGVDTLRVPFTTSPS